MASTASLWLKETHLQPDAFRPAGVARAEQHIVDNASPAPFSHDARPPVLAGSIRALRAERDACLEWRVVDDGRVLELARFTLQRAQTSVEHVLGEDAIRDGVPVRFRFPAIILPDVCWFEDRDTGVLHCVVLLASGTVMRLSFEQPALFYAAEEIGARNCFQYRMHSLTADRAPVVARAISADHLVVGCTDGSIVGVDLPPYGEQTHESSDQTAGEVNEVLLESTSFLSQVLATPVRLLSHAFRRNAAMDPMLQPVVYEPTSAAEQAIDLATYTFSAQDTFIFAVCRDRKLRAWSFVRRACVLSIALPSHADQREEHAKLVDALLPQQPRKCVWLLDGASHGSRYVFHLLVFVPGGREHSFVIYRGQLDDVGQLRSLRLVHERPCPWTCASGRSSESFGLVDAAFESVTAVESPEQSRVVRLWTLWQRKRDVDLRFTFLTLPASAALPSSSTSATDNGAPGRSNDVDFDDGENDDPAAYRAMYGDRWFPVVASLRDTLDMSKLSMVVEASTDAVAETFLRHIFAPGRFSRVTIELALELYTKDGDATLMGDGDIAADTSVRGLEESVANAVASRLVLPIYEPTGAPLLDELAVATKAEWFRFFTICVQLDQEARQPIGIAIAPRFGMVGVVRKDALSLLRSCSGPELLWHHATGQFDVAALPFLPGALFQDQCALLVARKQRDAVTCIFEALAALDEVASEDVLRRLDEDARALLVGPFCDSFVASGRELYEQLRLNMSGRARARIQNALRICGDVGTVLRQLLDVLSGHTQQETAATPAAFASSLLEAAVVTTLHDRVDASSQLCSRLLLLTLFWLSTAKSATDVNTSAELAHRCLEVLRCCANIARLSSQSHVPPISSGPSGALLSQKEPTSTDDGFIQHFSGLNMSDRQSPMVLENNKRCMSVAHLLIRHFYPVRHSIANMTGDITRAAGLLQSRLQPCDANHGAGQATARLAMQLVSLGLLDEARRLLQHMSRAPIADHLRGITFLRRMEFAKAKDCFVRAGAHFATGVAAVSAYYIYVADQFEQQSHYEYALDFCRLALTHLPNDAARAQTATMLHARIFRNALALSSYDEAYAAMMQNADMSQRRTCLRHLVTVLCEHGQVSKLCDYAFMGLQPEVDRTLQFKARNSDVFATPNYYKVLYSYNVFRGDFRNAARAMYQLARRLQDAVCTTSSHLDTIADQARSYLAAINALHLVERSHAWIVVEEDESSRSGRKRRRIRLPAGEGEGSAEVAVVELRDIRREYALSLAKLQLIRIYPEMGRSVCSVEADDAVMLFVQRAQYGHALSLSEALTLDLSPVFAGLVRRCVRLTQEELSGRVMVQETGTALLDTCTRIVSPYADMVEGSPASRVWKLLKQLLDRYDSAKTQHRYRLLVLNEILHADRSMRIPAWLVQFYSTNNPEDLIRVYLKYDLLEDAAKHALRQIEKEMTLARKESRKRVASAQEGRLGTLSHWLPYSLLDTLVKAMDELVGDSSAATDNVLELSMLEDESSMVVLHRRLSAQLKLYFSMVESEPRQPLAIS
ncbi:nucleoporin Nup120/160-domain-containing protein [Thamnocephalis sphaerospora]|uniref:Nucleoporin Nup120/160-domain-containing protein n=1 Tax=Thamnocephalis sphaerospora TaxID=78915 RepID=A0A4P9XRV0_9FUNG|nr:nucleoporin Nup120/160-domain-containing protein [Thamnocephalis sphaerospora]|eukprot:RKP08682.1 nucleoporin Nup120/160-domain-containing protein [Thamnocephalis sphaerospora]